MPGRGRQQGGARRAPARGIGGVQRPPAAPGIATRAATARSALLGDGHPPPTASPPHAGPVATLALDPARPAPGDPGAPARPHTALCRAALIGGRPHPRSPAPRPPCALFGCRHLVDASRARARGGHNLYNGPPSDPDVLRTVAAPAPDDPRRPARLVLGLDTGWRAARDFAQICARSARRP